MLLTLFLISLNYIRIFVRKVFLGKRFRVHRIQRISIHASMKVYDKGVLEIGKNCDFAPYSVVEVHGSGKLTIGAKSYFNRYCMVSAHENVSIGKGCMLGPGVKIFDNDHLHDPENGVSTKLKTKSIVIGDNTWLGSDVKVLKGAKIGRNCVIGAGCIIRGEVHDGSVVVCKQVLIVK